jgi:hypothetical protein
MKILLVAGAAVAIVACAAGGGHQAMAPSSQAAGAEPRPQTMPTDLNPNDPDHQQITELAAEIQKDSLALPPHAHAMTAPVAPDHSLTCAAPTGTKCTQSCTLSSSICANADKICTLADKLEGDAWAQQKCGDARQTCADAHKLCCDCTP